MKSAPAISAVVLLASSTLPTAAQNIIDERISLMLLEMTVEEKVGQMTQLSLQALSPTEGEPKLPGKRQVAPLKLRQAIVERHIGSVIDTHGTPFSAASWRDLVTGIQDLATDATRHKIPVICASGSVHGSNHLREATLFPHNLNLAATRNPDLVEKCHEISARETRSAGISWSFAPTLDVGRQPLWPRFFETFGEDVHLTNIMGEAAVRGLQGLDIAAGDKVAATGKHFLAYSYPITGRDHTQTLLPERYMREHFLPPFLHAIQNAQLRTPIVNSSEINGLPVLANHSILTKLLRGRMKFQGVLVTGWSDIEKLHTHHRTAPDRKEAVRLAVEAGIDMCMTPGDFSFTDHLIELVTDGSVGEDIVDESVRRILRLKFDLGLFDNPYPGEDTLPSPAEEAEQLTRQAAGESLVLLKNEDALPIGKDARILLTGPGCASLSSLHGAWSYSETGADESAYPQSLQTIVEVFEEKHGKNNINYVAGVSADGKTNYDLAARAAQSADVIVCVLTEPLSGHGDNDPNSFFLPPNQRRLVRELSFGKPLVLVLLENRPRLITEIDGLAHAVLFAGRPGPAGAEAIYDVLTGLENPSGKLPFTYPKAAHNILPYDHKLSDTAGNDPHDNSHALYEFGHGLSYSTFRYSNLNSPSTPLTQGDTLNLSVELTNTGDRTGSETVHVFVRDLYASVVPPVKRLRAFRKITLDPGSSKTIVFDIPITDLAFFGPNNFPIVEPGEFEVVIGDQKATFTVSPSADE